MGLFPEYNKECFSCKKEKECKSAHVYDEHTKCLGFEPKKVNK